MRNKTLIKSNKDRNSSIPNARFETYAHHGYVKITLRPGQQLRWGHRWATEEGWSSVYYEWELSADGREVFLYSCQDGRDCDGRLTTTSHFVAPTEELCEGNRRLDWRKCRPTRVYDEYARAAGY